MEVSKETEQKIGQLQMFEQSLQSFLGQKQQFQVQLVEIESALNELETAEKSYKIIGNIMVETDKNELKADLQSKKEKIEMPIKVNKALNGLGELSNDVNLQAYTRTQIWDIMSSLEKI